MNLSELILFLHSWTRWAVLASGIVTLLSGLTGVARRRAWDARDEAIARVFVASVDVQVLLGASLYFGVSPMARMARAVWASVGLGGLWASPELRFFGLMHPLSMLLGALVAHTSWVLARRSECSDARHRRIGAGAALTLAIFLAAIPRPFLGHERPWFRF
jgi:hypothetical protein